MKKNFTHLHVHSEYSLSDGAIRIHELLDRVKEFGHDAVALTDRNNLFGAVEFYQKAKDLEIKPIIGSDVFHSAHPSTRELVEGQEVSALMLHGGVFQTVLLAKTNQGYKNLVRTVSSAYLDPVCKDVPILSVANYHRYAEDMIVMIGHVRSELAFLLGQLRSELKLQGEIDFSDVRIVKAQSYSAIRSYLERMMNSFGEGNVYIELTSNNMPGQVRLMDDLAITGEHFKIPLVASADAHYLTKDDAEAHAAVVAIKNDLTMSKIRDRRKDAEFHVFTLEEMEKKFKAYPEAIANTQKIAEACNVSFTFGEYFLPTFDLGTGESAEEALRRLSLEGLEERFKQLQPLYGSSFNEEAKEVYYKRLEYELGVICSMGFPGYFLIVQDFINWAKENDIPVGPGRGSGAGSLVAYSLKITDLDPLPYNLIFERFLNPERVSMPDFDVDFCQFRRDEVIRYVVGRYGKENVAQITTFGKMLAKAAIRDVGRVLELGYTKVDGIARLIPEEIGIKLKDALEREPRLGQAMSNDENVDKLIKLAMKLEGINRHTSVHAAGVVISEGGMDNFVPVYKSDDGGLITQFEMKNAEKVGLVKFDFLGLKTLTVIKKASDLVRERHNPEFNIEAIPLEDKRVYDLISRALSTGVFQLESTGMQKLLLKLQPSTFEDIIALVALFRPGPLQSGMVDDFVERKHGRQAIEYPLPQLEPILKDTYGTILYQEQVQKVAAVLAKYSLGEADLLRRAMGKKKPEEMAKQKKRFVDGCLENKIDQNIAEQIFELMAKFAQYGFNKSHSAAYGLVSYQTAYLKTHYTEEFMAAIMTCDMDNTAKVVNYIKDCKNFGITVLPPDINKSFSEFTVPKAKNIAFGLAAIKGVGANSIVSIINDRNENGPFKSLVDLAKRIDLRVVGKKNLELLVAAGAFDKFGYTRSVLHKHIGALVRFSEDLHGAKSSGQGMLFGDMEEEEADDEQSGFTIATNGDLKSLYSGGANEWPRKEKSLMGISLKTHLLDLYSEDINLFSNGNLADPKQLIDRGTVNVVCLLSDYFERLTRTGKKMMILRLEDKFGEISPALFEDEFPEAMPPKDTVIIASLRVIKNYDPSLEPRIKLDSFMDIEEYRRGRIKRVDIAFNVEKLADSRGAEIHQQLCDELNKLAEKHHGDVPVHLALGFSNAEVKLRSKKLSLEINDEVLQTLHDLRPVLSSVQLINR